MLKFLCVFAILVGAFAIQIDGEDRVIGGQAAKSAQFPFQGTVHIPVGRYDRLCGAAILSKDFLVSTANCLYDAGGRYSGYAVLVGTTSSRRGGYEYQVHKVHLHPDYRSGVNNIGLIRTVKPISFLLSVQPIALPTFDASTHESFPVRLSGFGQNHVSKLFAIKYKPIYMNIPTEIHLQKDDTWPDVLFWGYAATLNRTECRNLIDKAAIHVDTLCSQNAIGNGACQGDQGGLLTTYGKPSVLVGILVEAEGCVAHEVELNVNVFHHLNFIRGYLNS